MLKIFFALHPRFAIILGGESCMLNEIFAGFAFLIFSSIGKSPRVIISSFGGGSRGLIVQLYRLEVGILTFFCTFAWFFGSLEEKKCANIMEPPKNTTRDIIASQNQDYVDEGLAEYQDQIQKLQCKF